jgi:hypothetical protein
MAITRSKFLLSSVTPFLVYLIFVICLVPTDSFAGNKADCREWCGNHADDGCVKCSTKAGCGSGYKAMKHFRGRGRNYHACKLNNFGRRGEENHQECEAWCDGNQNCEKCSTIVGCGSGYNNMKSFRGPGKNWYACQMNQSRRASELNKSLCKEWCETSSICDKCSTHVGCGVGYRSVASFARSGNRWYACLSRDRGRFSPARSWCEGWCEQVGEAVCKKCSSKRGCGTGYREIATFGDWHACGATMHGTMSNSNKEDCIAWCREDDRCTRCSESSGCGVGYQSIKKFGRTQSWYGCQER